jgi:hypothetical protein
MTFLVGAVLGTPGVSYLAAMDLLARQHASTFTTVLVVLAWNVIMLLIVEIALSNSTAATFMRSA